MIRKLSKLAVAILVVAMSSQAHAENRLLFDVSGTSFHLATTGNTVSLVLQNSDDIKAIQLKVVSNTPDVILKEVRQGNRTLGEGWTVHYHNVSEVQVNVLIANFGGSLFEAGEGTIAEIVFDVSGPIVGEFFPLSLEEIKAADPQGNRVELFFDGGPTVAATNEVDVEFVVSPSAVSLSIGNRSEISKLEFEAKLEGATVIDQPDLRGRAEGMLMRFERFSDRVVVVLEKGQGISIEPGIGEILEIPIQSSRDVRVFVHEMALLGSDNKTLESRVRVVEGSQQPQLFILHQNYPNPFNPSTTISYDLRAGTHVTLIVYSAFGQEVATLVRGEQPAGEYSFIWNGTNDRGDAVSSGAYIYRLTAGESNVTKKMNFLK